MKNNRIYLLVPFFLFFLSFFWCCSKNDGNVTKSYLKDTDEVKQTTPIFSVMDGYLHLSNLDDVSKMLTYVGNMSETERKSWERNYDFVSATTYYEEVFNIYEALETEEQLISFCEEYKDILLIEYEDGVSIYYPFKPTFLLPLLSKDGCIAIRNTFYIYKKDRNIEIEEFTTDKIERYKDATESIPEEGVSVTYFDEVSTRASQIDQVRVWEHPTSTEWDKDGNYRFKVYLETYRLKTQQSTDYYEYRNIVILYMRAEKKRSIGGWSHFDTEYRVRDIRGEYRNQRGTQSLGWNDMVKSFKGGGHIRIYESLPYYGNAYEKRDEHFSFTCNFSYYRHPDPIKISYSKFSWGINTAYLEPIMLWL